MDGTEILQNGLLVAVAHGGVLGDIIRQITRVAAGQYVHQQVGRYIACQLRISLKHFVNRAQQGLRFGAGPVCLYLWDQLHLGHEKGLLLGHLQELAAADTLYHHPDISSGHAQDLPHRGDSAHCVQVLFSRHFYGDILLSHQENGTSAGHGLFQRLSRDLPGHVKVDQHAGKYGQPPKGNNRNGRDRFLTPFSCHKNSLPSGKQQRPGARRRWWAPRGAFILLDLLFSRRCGWRSPFGAQPAPDGAAAAAGDHEPAPAWHAP